MRLGTVLNLLAVLCWLGPAGATTVVGVRTKSAIIVGADGRGASAPGGASAACKIRGCGSGFAALAGSLENDANVLDALSRACADGANPSEMADQFATGIKASFSGATSRLKQRVAQPAHQGQAGGPLISALFFAMVQGEPAFARRDVFVADDGALRISSHTCPGNCDAQQQMNVFMMGDTERAAELLRAEPMLLAIEPPLGLINRLIDAQASATPASVGRPIDVLTIDKRGARWLQREAASACTELKAPTQ